MIQINLYKQYNISKLLTRDYFLFVKIDYSINKHRTSIDDGCVVARITR